MLIRRRRGGNRPYSSSEAGLATMGNLPGTLVFFRRHMYRTPNVPCCNKLEGDPKVGQAMGMREGIKLFVHPFERVRSLLVTSPHSRRFPFLLGKMMMGLQLKPRQALSLDISPLDL